ncbi:MAG TPA: hypothetical protein VGH38_37155 [Bryobacteraceae bacterium]
MKQLTLHFLMDEDGQDLIEYTLLMVFVAWHPPRCSSAPAGASTAI